MEKPKATRSKPIVLENTLPKEMPTYLSYSFYYNFAKPKESDGIGLVTEVGFILHEGQDPEKYKYKLSMRSVLSIQTKHSLDDNIKIFHKLILVTIDEFRVEYSNLDINNYPSNLEIIAPYPPIQKIKPVLMELLSPEYGRGLS